jgi:hypothetical protein
LLKEMIHNHFLNNFKRIHESHLYIPSRSTDKILRNNFVISTNVFISSITLKIEVSE